MSSSVFKAGRAVKQIQRYHEILNVLLKYGLEDIADILHLEKHIGLERLARPLTRASDARTRAERVRMVLEELGPAFIKVGQFLSTRADLLPPELLAQLRLLQDHVPPFAAKQAKEIIESDFGRPLTKIFLHFESEPFAAASIGQAHRARLVSGEEVVVKVQRPDIHPLVEVDLEIVRQLAAVAERRFEKCKKQRLTTIIDGWAHGLLRELDYTIEAAHMERFARDFQSDPTARVPRVCREILSPRVLVCRWLDGVKASDTAGLKRRNYPLARIARRALAHVMKEVFIDGFFHADPHPGNILILPGGVIGYLDFGMMGRLDRPTREGLASAILGITRRDPKALQDALVGLSQGEEPQDAAGLEKRLGELIDDHAYHPLKEIRVGPLFQEALTLCADYDLIFSSELFLLAKALGNLESLIRLWDPGLDLIGAAAPFMERLEKERLSPVNLARTAVETGLGSWSRLKRLPEEVRGIVHQINRGRLKIEFEHRGLEPLIAHHDQISNRLAFALVLSALIIGSALIVLADVAPHWRGMPVIGLSGFILAALMALRLIISILRHGRF